LSAFVRLRNLRIAINALVSSNPLWHVALMSADELRKLLNARPFRPFTVFMPNDKSFRIPHSEFALITPNGRTMVVSESNSDAVDILDVPLIARIEVEAAQPRDS